MKKLFFKGRFVFIPLAIAAFVSLASFLVMQLWNNLLPDIFHITTITFWQAMGIFILCKILFGFGRGGGRGFRNAPWMRHKMEERLKSMTPEQREKFRQKMQQHNCGPWGREGGRSFYDWETPPTEAAKPTE
jgi:hypothetical protein